MSNPFLRRPSLDREQLVAESGPQEPSEGQTPQRDETCEWLEEQLKPYGEWKVVKVGDTYHIAPAGNFEVKRDEAGRTLLVWKYPEKRLTVEVEPSFIEHLASDLLLHRWLMKHGYLREIRKGDRIEYVWVKEPPKEVQELLLSGLPREWKKAYESERWIPPWKQERSLGGRPRVEVSAEGLQGPPIPTALGGEQAEIALEREFERGAAESYHPWLERLATGFLVGALTAPVAPAILAWQSWREKDPLLLVTMGLWGRKTNIVEALARDPFGAAGMIAGGLFGGLAVARAAPLLDPGVALSRVLPPKVEEVFYAERVGEITTVLAREGSRTLRRTIVSLERVPLSREEALRLLAELGTDVSGAPRFRGARTTIELDGHAAWVHRSLDAELSLDEIKLYSAADERLPDGYRLVDRFKPAARIIEREKVGGEAGGMARTLLERVLREEPERISRHLERVEIDPIIGIARETRLAPRRLPSLPLRLSPLSIIASSPVRRRAPKGVALPKTKAGAPPGRVAIPRVKAEIGQVLGALEDSRQRRLAAPARIGRVKAKIGQVPRLDSVPKLRIGRPHPAPEPSVSAPRFRMPRVAVPPIGGDVGLGRRGRKRRRSEGWVRINPVGDILKAFKDLNIL